VSVAVYPRLGELLRARNLTVAELGREIATRFGLLVDSESLDSWAQDTPVRRADLELAGAAAAVLNVNLSDLFEVNLTPDRPDEGAVLDATAANRLSELLDLQQSRELSETESAEMAALVDEYSRELRERGLTATAARRGITVDQARGELQAEVDNAAERWESLRNDPERHRAVVAELKRRRRRATSRT
jgi:hypothetical protein